MTTETTVQSLAAEAYSYFTTGKRSDGSSYWKAEGEPQWVKDLIYAAHDNGEILPDDQRYQMIADALSALEDNEDPDNAEVDAPIYTHELTSWLGSRADRSDWCDEYKSEFGVYPDTFNTLNAAWSGVMAHIAAGYWMEANHVLQAVRSFLETRAEELGAESEDEEEESDD